MIAHYHDISAELLSAADLVIAIDPAKPLEEKEVYCNPAFAGGKSVLRAVRVIVAILDSDEADDQIESLRQAVYAAKSPAMHPRLFESITQDP